MSTFFEKLAGSRPKTSGSSAITADLDTSKNSAESTGASLHAETRDQTTEDTRENMGSHETTAMEKDMPDAEEEGELTVDIYDKNDVIVIQSTVAGVKPEDLEVSITSDMVSIKGTRQCIDRVAEDRYYYKELFWGTFARSVILPEEIDENHTEASLKHGLLTITLPKKKKGIAQKVKIKSI